ncbi:unnamed protein product [Vitrella brassicaformis CCMP3155]|uniref:Protein kinase domain-containing protein n=1 Tax=Vitrella brassicaformis (strain CCMP3155) TaxID=1169540 RepID=A0A0G4FXG8_VITBC|nr:unnamed protein product [Vitrella brassicaformis CCMP3155]|eukprot:CEM20103.1 unnamed protein product [Vitrella brassicaformis CCMP3155]
MKPTKDTRTREPSSPLLAAQATVAPSTSGAASPVTTTPTSAAAAAAAGEGGGRGREGKGGVERGRRCWCWDRLIGRGRARAEFLKKYKLGKKLAEGGLRRLLKSLRGQAEGPIRGEKTERVVKVVKINKNAESRRERWDTNCCLKFLKGRRHIVSAMTPEEVDEELKLLDLAQYGRRRKDINGHPNIVKVHDIYRDNSSCFIVMDRYVADLSEFDASKVSEEELAEMTADMVHAVYHLHRNDIVHRFGVARYQPPEVWRNDYGKKPDMWSLGVVLKMGDGLLPVKGGNEEVLRRVIEKRMCTFKRLEQKTPLEFVDLVQNLLVTDPKRRISADEALEHAFIQHVPPRPRDVRPRALTTTSREEGLGGGRGRETHSTPAAAGWVFLTEDDHHEAAAAAAGETDGDQARSAVACTK